LESETFFFFGFVLDDLRMVIAFLLAFKTEAEREI
jgi:hypothetical protein